MLTTKNDNNLILMLNIAGVVAAYLLLGLSLYHSVNVPLATKGYWGMGIVLLTLSLVNVVKYRFDGKASEDRINRIEDARNERMLEEMIADPKD